METMMSEADAWSCQTVDRQKDKQTASDIERFLHIIEANLYRRSAIGNGRDLVCKWN